MTPVQHGEPAHDEPGRYAGHAERREQGHELAREPVAHGAPPRPAPGARVGTGPQRAPGWYRRSVVLAIVAALGVPAAHGATWRQEAQAATPWAASAPTPAPTHVQSGTTAVPPTAAVADLLRRRSRAVLAR
ncbi:MAG TPA: hypothetical protein VEV65_03280, partial [Kineosporiaceae bacterium]|nr:hypothetical protein [Kineosporiaceae bacterium]